MLTYSDHPMTTQAEEEGAVASAVSTVHNDGSCWVQAEEFFRDLQCENRGV